MLFSSIVFMSRGQWINIVLIFVLKWNIASSSQMPHDSIGKLSGDFEGFLKDLGSMVYKSKKKFVNGKDLRSNHDRYTTSSFKNYRKSDNIYNSQKAALGDVLMMKLVSYYEDKYKLTHIDPTTTETITFMNTFTKSADRYNVEPFERAEFTDNRLQNQFNRANQASQANPAIQANQAYHASQVNRANQAYQANQVNRANQAYQVNQANQASQAYQVNQAYQMNQATMERSRRMEGEVMRRMDEEYNNIPEVIIL